MLFHNFLSEILRIHRYIHFVKRNFRPVLSKEAENVISSYYQLQRRSATQNAGFTYKTTCNSISTLIQYYCFSCVNCFMLQQGPPFVCWRVWYDLLKVQVLPVYQLFVEPLPALMLLIVVAHARLMFRNEVTRLDAITAILCIESSMTTSAIVDSVGNALHSNFAENPDEECILCNICFLHPNLETKNSCTNSIIQDGFNFSWWSLRATLCLIPHEINLK